MSVCIVHSMLRGMLEAIALFHEAGKFVSLQAIHSLVTKAGVTVYHWHQHVGVCSAEYVPSLQTEHTWLGLQEGQL